MVAEEILQNSRLRQFSFSFSLPVITDVVYAAFQILYPRLLALQKFVRFVCFLLCEKQVPHIIFQRLVGLSITSKKSESTARETKKHPHAYALWHLSHRLNFSTRCCNTLIFFVRRNRNEPNLFYIDTILHAYFIKWKKVSFARSVYANLFIYLLSLFYI